MAGKRARHRRTAPRTQPETGERTPSPDGGLRAWLPALLVLVAVAAVFGRTVEFGFTDWDDDTNIYRNPGVVAPSWDALAGFWTAPYANLYVPLVYTTFMAEAWLGRVLTGDLAPSLFHLTNVVLHALSALAVLRLLRTRLPLPAALAGTLLFAIHPLQAEAVAWATGRKDVLSGCLMLWALERLDRHLSEGGRGRYAAATGLFVLALFAKPAAVVAPLMALALVRDPVAEWRRLARLMGPWLLVSLAWVFVTRGSQIAVTPDSDFWVPAWKRVFVAADSLLFYAAKVVLPLHLTPMVPQSNRDIFDRPLTWIAPLLVAAGAALLLWRGRGAVRGVWWFAVPLLPVLGLVPFIYQYHSNVADRYVYTGMLGAGLLAGQLVGWAGHGSERRTKAALALAGALLLMLGGMTVRQSGFWSSREALWGRVLQLNPRNVHALFNLGAWKAYNGDADAALELFGRVVDVDPAYGRVYPNLLLLASRSGRDDDVARYSEMALRLRPGNVDNHLARGHAYLLRDDPAGAETEFRGAVFGLPDDPETHVCLGVALLAQGRAAEAEQSLRVAAELNPVYATARANLGLALLAQGKTDAARQELQAAITLEPRDERSHRALEAIERGEFSPPSR